MSPTTRTKTGALDQLADLKRQAAEAQQRVQSADAERASSARWLPAAQAKLAEYLVAVEMGQRDRDLTLERELRDAAADLEVMRVEIGRRGDSIQWADRRALNRLEDARLAAQDAQSAVNTYVVEHRAQLQEEMCQRALDARDQLIAAIEHLSSAGGNWSAVARDWRQLLEQWPDISPAEIPTAPLPGVAMQDIEMVALQIRGGAKDPRGALPMPTSLAPGGEDEERHHPPLRGWEHVPRVISSAGGLGA